MTKEGIHGLIKKKKKKVTNRQIPQKILINSVRVCVRQQYFFI